MASSSISKQQVGLAARRQAAHADDGDILTTLRREHAEIKTLLERLQVAEAAVERRQLVKQVKARLLAHISAEEEVLYAAVIMLKDPHARQAGHEGYLEHEWSRKTLQRLERIRDPNSAEHRAAAKVLCELVVHHIRDEERSVWSDVRQHFDEPARAGLNREYLAARSRTRGH